MGVRNSASYIQSWLRQNQRWPAGLGSVATAPEGSDNCANKVPPDQRRSHRVGGESGKALQHAVSKDIVSLRGVISTNGWRYAAVVQKNPFQRIKHIPGQALTYLQNPKVASKSIERSLWLAYDRDGAPINPYAVRDRPFLRRPDELLQAGVDSLKASK